MRQIKIESFGITEWFLLAVCDGFVIYCNLLCKNAEWYTPFTTHNAIEQIKREISMQKLNEQIVALPLCQAK